jgi:hypothetical protein
MYNSNVSFMFRRPVMSVTPSARDAVWHNSMFQCHLTATRLDSLTACVRLMQLTSPLCSWTLFRYLHQANFQQNVCLVICTRLVIFLSKKTTNWHFVIWFNVCLSFCQLQLNFVWSLVSVTWFLPEKVDFCVLFFVSLKRHLISWDTSVTISVLCLVFEVATLTFVYNVWN